MTKVRCLLDPPPLGRFVFLRPSDPSDDDRWASREEKKEKRRFASRIFPSVAPRVGKNRSGANGRIRNIKSRGERWGACPILRIIDGAARGFRRP